MTPLVGLIIHLLSMCASSYVSANIGFTTDLIHRDSPLSPFYNPSRTHYDNFRDASLRSLKRVGHFLTSEGEYMEAPLTPGGGEYLMKVSLGTPPVDLVGIADTGSDLTWTQCLPCTQCYPQTLRLYDPSRSSSYHTVSCDSDSCSKLPTRGCDQQNNCKYQCSYGDGATTQGDLATETFTIGGSSGGGNSSLANIVFGCGRANSKFFKGATGLVGLGGGKLSLVSQLGESGNKFSYCLNPKLDTTSKISFGSDATVSGSGVVTTPIVTKTGRETFYYLTLVDFTIGSNRIAFANNKTSDDEDDDDEGNIIIDSGTVLTLLPQDFFDDLVSALEDVISLPKVDDPSGLLKLCYSSHSSTDYGRFPNVTVHFKGADVLLQPMNTFAEVAENLICLTMLPSAGVVIFGNLAQVNFLVGYDLHAATVSFKPTNCATQTLN